MHRTVLSLFSGVGGMDLGFTQAGFQVVWANDNYSDAADTYRRNLGDHIVEEDVLEIESSAFPECDVIIGGFPCQGFSVANTQRSKQDGRNRLYLEFVRVLSATMPRVFVAENVPGILSLEGGDVLKTIVSDFSDVGYRVSYKVLNAADFGVPQLRRRVFIVGIRSDVSLKSDSIWPTKTHADPSSEEAESLSEWVSVGEALDHLSPPGPDSDVANHASYSKYKLRFNGYLGHRTIDASAPAPTVTGRGDMKGGVVVMHHPSNTRRMSPRETAIVQGFPDDFVFSGTNSSVYRQVANAVPPPLAKAVALALSKAIVWDEQKPESSEVAIDATTRTTFSGVQMEMGFK
ncbi:MAG: DNA cytosine methyltransferase [Rhodothermales bacterium]